MLGGLPQHEVDTLAWRLDPGHPVLRQTAEQLQQYFAGERRDFDMALDLSCGTPFQQRVWRALLAIGHGQTCSYGDIAQVIGNPKGVRAVGLANGRNPLPIIVPCHRVIGADGSMTGFGGGIDSKRFLLDLEARHVDRGLQLRASR